MCDKLKRRYKRNFSDAWLTDDRFKSWIGKVSFDDTLFHCTICNKNFSCSLSHVLRHADSACHKNNIKAGRSLLNNNNNASFIKKATQKRFKDKWLEIELFKPWLREVSSDRNLIFCTFCDVSIAAGLSQIYRHAKSKKHIAACKENETSKSIKNINPKNMKCESEEHEIIYVDETGRSIGDLNGSEEYEMTHTSNCMDDINRPKRHEITGKRDEISQSIEDRNVSLLPFEDRKKLAEIRFAALIADRNISFEASKEILTLFQEIGKDYNILKNMNIGRTKCTNIISRVLSPVEMDYVIESIQNTKFSILIDEASDVSAEKWITFFVRYVDPKTLNVRSQLLKLINLNTRNCNAEKLFNAFKSEIWKLDIPFSNIVALLCDNASIMTDKPLTFKEKLEEICTNTVALRCPCYSAALAAHVANTKMPDYCEKFLKQMANFICDSPKMSSIYQDFQECFQETNRKIFKSPDAWLLSHYSYIEKLVESWYTVKLFLKEYTTNSKTKSGMYLLSMMQCLDLKAYLLYLKHILHHFNSFSVFFQVVETRIHLMQPKSVEFLTTICKQFLKSDRLNNLDNIKFSDMEHQKLLQEIHLGSECEEYLDELIKEGHTDVVQNIRKNCLQFYITAAEEINKRLPITDKFLSKLKVFQFYSAIIDMDREASFNDVCFIAETIGDFDENGLKEEWFILPMDFATEKKKLSKLNFDDMWKQILQSQHATNIDKYPNLKCLLNGVRAFPNSNTDPERIFSALAHFKTKRRKLSTSSINTICVFKSALKAKGKTSLNMDINAKHLSLMSSDILYNTPRKQKKSSPKIYADVNYIAGPSSSDDV